MVVVLTKLSPLENEDFELKAGTERGLNSNQAW